MSIPNPRGRDPSWVRRLGTLWLAFALAACGGGVDSGGTGSASFASGSITGFGSVIVNDVRFDDSSASVTDDTGAARSRDELRLGMTTEIRGSAITLDASGARVATATSITFGSEVLGRIASIDRPANRLVVLGQTVEVTATTVFDNVSVAGGLAALAVGDIVEVYALYDAASARYTATRIEREPGATSFKLRGVVGNLDPVARTFTVGTERISYATAAGAPAGLANGAFVRVRLQTAQVNGVWQVSTLDSGVPVLRDADDVRLEGRISAFTSVTQFSVNGVPVDASGASPVAGLALGVRVEVKGTARGAVLIATEVEVRTNDGGGDDDDDERFELRGSIASVNPAQASFELRGVTIGYSASTRFSDDGSAADLAAGVEVEARGELSSDGTRLVASRITFR